MTTTVRVVRATPVLPATISKLFGTVPLPVEHVESPSILVDGRFHNAANRWLNRKWLLRPVESTVVSHALRLSQYIAYLRGERCLDGSDERQADVFAATATDVSAYYRARQFTPETRVSSATWRAQLSTIKQFHEYLFKEYAYPLPFNTFTLNHPAGYKNTSAPDLRPRTRTASRGTPITPGFADLLVQGAYRTDSNGRQTTSRNVDRDAALISLGLGTGLRLGTLANVTTYEIPTLNHLPFTTIRVPDFITKGDAGGDALVFAHRLHAVHNYIEGARAAMIAEAKPYKPADPVHIIEADADSWATIMGDKIRRYRWTETDADTRRQLVNPDQSTPIVWLNSYTATPISYYHAARITPTARDWTIEHIRDDFPPAFRTHDLRHTYATHLTVCIFMQALAPHVSAQVTDAYTPIRIADAVEIAKFSLGHASETSTRLYVQHAPKFLHINVGTFLGDR